MSAIFNMKNTGSPKTLLYVFGLPLVLMLSSKAVRMDRKNEHDIMMRAKFHSDFMQRGNDFAKDLKGKIHEQLHATEDKELVDARAKGVGGFWEKKSAPPAAAAPAAA